jgi:dTMP kinase
MPVDAWPLPQPQELMAGRFIVLEGVEGSGKSTQAALLSEWLERTGIAHLRTREPGGTAVGEEIRRILLHGDEITPRSELFLLLAARSALVEREIRPALAAGKVVVADRYGLSTLAYQAHGRALPHQAVRSLNDFATGGLRPDLTVVLDVPVGVGAARRAAAGQGADRIEAAGAAFHDRVAEAYRLLVESEECVESVDGTGSAAAVHASILALLMARFPETFGRTTG